MVEIILRKDIQDYEPRPLFGFTYRQAVTAALITASSAALGVGLAQLGVLNTVTLTLVMAVGAAIGFVGLGRFHGLKFEQWRAIAAYDRAWPKVALFSAPRLSPASERAKSARPRPSRRDRRQARLLARQSAREIETM